MEYIFENSRTKLVVLLMAIFCSCSSNVGRLPGQTDVTQEYNRTSHNLLKMIEAGDYDGVISKLDGKFKGEDAIKANLRLASKFIEKHGFPTEDQIIINKKQLGVDNEIITVTYYLPKKDSKVADRIQFYYFFKKDGTPKPWQVFATKYKTKEEKMKIFEDMIKTDSIE